MEAPIVVFQTDSLEVNEVYKQNTNYLIEYSDTKLVSEKYCALYFSSHDIYYPNTAEAFQNQLLRKNKFEWYGTRIEKAEKHIFLRDIKKQWYLSGVNSRLSTVEKLTEFLKEETSGYRIIAVGSSAGGFAAVLFGQLLQAETIFSFNGQFHVSDLLESSSENLNPLVFREQLNPEINKYYSLHSFIKNPASVFYFYSNKSTWDLLQYNHVADLQINFIAFKTNHHGIPFLKIALPKVIAMNHSQLKTITNRLNNPLFFTIHSVGLIKTKLFILKELVRVIKSKLNK